MLFMVYDSVSFLAYGVSWCRKRAARKDIREVEVDALSLHRLSLHLQDTRSLPPPPNRHQVIASWWWICSLKVVITLLSNLKDDLLLRFLLPYFYGQL